MTTLLAGLRSAARWVAPLAVAQTALRDALITGELELSALAAASRTEQVDFYFWLYHAWWENHLVLDGVTYELDSSTVSDPYERERVRYAAWVGANL